MQGLALDAHPWLAQFALVPLSLSLVFYVLIRWLPDGRLRAEWGALARWSLWLGSGFLVAATASGVLAAVDRAPEGVTRVALVGHAYWAYAASAAYLVVFGWSVWGHRRFLRSAREQGLPFLVGTLLAAALLIMAVSRGVALAHPASDAQVLPVTQAQAAGGRPAPR